MDSECRSHRIEAVVNQDCTVIESHVPHRCAHFGDRAVALLEVHDTERGFRWGVQVAPQQVGGQFIGDLLHRATWVERREDAEAYFTDIAEAMLSDDEYWIGPAVRKMLDRGHEFHWF